MGDFVGRLLLVLDSRQQDKARIGAARGEILMIFLVSILLAGCLGCYRGISSNTTGRRNVFSVVICGLYLPCIRTYMCLVVLCNYEVYVLNHCFPLSITFISHNVSHILCFAPFCFQAEVLTQNSHFTQAYTNTDTSASLTASP